MQIQAVAPGRGRVRAAARGSRSIRTEHVETALKSAAICSWAALAALSLSPAKLRLGDVGCAVAFFLAATVTRLAFRRFETRWQLTGFALAAGVLWSCQAWMTSQDVPAVRWLASASGAFAGAVTARTLVHGRNRGRSAPGRRA